MSEQEEPQAQPALQPSTGACFLVAPEPPDEIERLIALRNLELLDTPREERFDDLVGLASRIFEAPIAYVSLVDDLRQWFKSSIGMPFAETPRNVSFCSHTILQELPLIIPDTLADPRFAGNPMVSGEPHIRFYAGQSLKDASGHRVGTLCLADHQARAFRDKDADLLRRLAGLAERELNMRDTMRMQELTLRLQDTVVENQSQLSKLYDEVCTERDKSDSLLLNILPRKVATELKESGRVQAMYFDAACVMFTDFTDFTSISAALAPAELVEELNICFSAFDEMTVRHGVEKLKTVGDGYLCMSGAPEQCPTAALDIALTAIEIREFVAKRNAAFAARGRSYWNVRIGLHRGPLVAGVVGVKKFAFDVWGDTVNTASRIETSSLPGRINMSQEFRDALPPEALCEPRGKVSVKGKGEIEMYFLNELASAAQGD